MNEQKTNSPNNIVKNEEISESLEQTMSAKGRKSPENIVSLPNNVPIKEKKKRRPRVTLSLEQKLVIIKLILIGKKIRNIAQEFGIPHTYVYYLMRDKKKIIQKANELQEADFKIIQILKDVKYLIQFRPLEDYLNKWLGAMYVKGLPVSVAEFQAKALEFYKELKGTYYFDPGYDWVCYFENRWCHKFLRDGIKNASDNNNFLMRKRFKVDDDHDQSQQAYRKNPEDASINDTSNFNASGNVERQVSNDCESQQNTESTKYNPNELEVYDSTLLYKMTFNDCIHSLKVPDFAHLLSDNQREDLENNLRYFMSTMTSVEQLLNDLLMNEIWKPFGKFMCFGDVAWVCQLKIKIEKESKERNINQKAVLCTACYEKLKDSYQKYDCVKESKFHQLDLDFNIMQRTCSVCLKSTIYYRPAAQCCFCIIMFWVAKNIVLSLHSRNEINKEHHWLK